MCTDEHKTYLTCGHVAITRYECPAFQKRKSRNSTRQQYANFKRLNVSEPYKCNKYGKEFCVKPSRVAAQGKATEKQESKDVPMGMGTNEFQPEAEGISKGGLLNPKGTPMAWETSSEGQQKPAIKGGRLNPSGKKMAWETSDDEGESAGNLMDVDTANKSEVKGAKDKPNTGFGGARRGNQISGRGQGRGRGRGRGGMW